MCLIHTQSRVTAAGKKMTEHPKEVLTQGCVLTQGHVVTQGHALTHMKECGLIEQISWEHHKDKNTINNRGCSLGVHSHDTKVTSYSAGLWERTKVESC